MAEGRFVSYYRVSTEKQGRSGLGLEGQKADVMRYLNGGNWKLVDEFTEVESGKDDDNRPQLQAAFKACRLKKATLLIAKLDRLSRDAYFLLGLQKAGVDFVCADMPDANKMTVGIMSIVAQNEREQISARTKTALAAAKARGVALGGYRGGPVVDGRLGAQANRDKADAYAKDVLPTITKLRDDGLSLRQIAARLTEDGIQTARGGQWSAMAVHNVLARS